MALLRWYWLGVCAVACATAQTPLSPVAASYDASGNLFFVDSNRNQVFEVALSGALTVVAGNGTQGFSGDGGAATSAALNEPQGIAVGSDGAVYVADTANQRVRKIVGGVISTVAGTGVAGFSGDGGVAFVAELRRPTALAMDSSGALLICDTGNQRVRKVAGGVIGTVAGSGVQGFGGDGGSAVAAEMNSPEGVTVFADGRMVVADTQNQRIRLVDGSGVITTIAGIGVAGYAGDGGQAVAAKIDLPDGLSASGEVLYIADSNNERVRMIDAQGNISTLVGTGVQGSSSDGTLANSAKLNLPRAVAAGPNGVAVVDVGDGSIRVFSSGGTLYAVAPMPASRISQVAMQAGSSVTYGQGAATVSVSGSAGMPKGSVVLQDGGVSVETAMLVAAFGSLDLSGLNVGVHPLQALYSGDGVNPAGVSAVSSVSVMPAVVSVSPNDATMVYGTAMPQLSGILSGVLARDTNGVAVEYQTTASLLSPVGSYSITAQLSGTASGNYSLTLGRSAQLAITQAPTSVAMQQAGQSYAGLPLVLSVSLHSSSSGTPSGTVNFEENGVTIAQGGVVNGAATATYLSPAQGAHVFTAVYSGDQNFLGSSSATQAVAVAAMPDYSLSASTASETVPGGLSTSYVIHAAPTGGPFTGVVMFSVAGLQPGATATFSPAVVVPGSGGADVTMSVQTVALAWRMRGGVVLAVGFPMLFVLRKRRGRLLLVPVCLSLAGCGARTVAGGTVQKQTYQVTVTGVGTNLAGQVVSHSTQMTLIVE